MKWIFCIALFVLCLAVSMLFTRKYFKRKTFYYNIYFFNEKLLAEIVFSKLPLPKFIEKHQNLGDCLLFFDSEKKIYTPEEYQKITYLTEDEKVYFFDYYQMLGKSDAKSQREYLESVRQELQQKKTQEEENYKKHFTLNLKLGILVGLIGILILL